jgi:rfaE bifunctional protein kinase chain/domain
MIAFERVEELLSRFGGLRIGLLGDLFLDRYLEINSALTEPSLETGLDAYQVTRIRNSPGALGTVMNNLAALGVGRLVPVTVIGDDGHGFDLLQELGKLPVDLDGVVQDPARLTPTYTKPMLGDATGSRELNRLDVRTRDPIAEAVLGDLCDRLRRVFDDADGLIVVDQLVEDEQGVVSARIREFLAELCERCPQKVVFVDSRAHIAKFRRGILKTNDRECLSAMGIPSTDDLVAISAAVRARAKQNRGTVVCTLGDRGMLVADRSTEPIHVPGYPVAGPIDVVGAGDSATSGIVAALLAGGTLVEAAAMGNLVASITVQQIGTTGTASPDQVRARWREYHPET